MKKSYSVCVRVFEAGFVFERGDMPCLPEGNSDGETLTQTHYAADGSATVKTLTHTPKHNPFNLPAQHASHTHTFLGS